MFMKLNCLEAVTVVVCPTDEKFTQTTLLKQANRKMWTGRQKEIGYRADQMFSIKCPQALLLK